MACVVTIWLTHLNNAVLDQGNTLALTDNSSCVGWLHKCNFFEDTHPVQDATAFKLPHRCLENKTTIHAQHIKGKKN
jgi:hypothetical protein